jgi:hypothetical protein
MARESPEQREKRRAKEKKERAEWHKALEDEPKLAAEFDAWEYRTRIGPERGCDSCNSDSWKGERRETEAGTYLRCTCERCGFVWTMEPGVANEKPEPYWRGAKKLADAVKETESEEPGWGTPGQEVDSE